MRVQLRIVTLLRLMINLCFSFQTRRIIHNGVSNNKQVLFLRKQYSYKNTIISPSTFLTHESHYKNNISTATRSTSSSSSSFSSKTRLFSSTSTKEAVELETKKQIEIKLYNSLTNEKEILKPVKKAAAESDSESNYISMYSCGPTVYDYAHVGNFRAFLTYDVLKRVLTYFGYNVDHVCNLTDIDDKIIARCDREDISLKELTLKFEQLFMDDLFALNIIPANSYPRATDYIDEMVEFIQDLQKAGLAYQSTEGSWYFNVAKKEGYGKQLVSLDIQEDDSVNEQQTALDADEYDAEKVGLRDFALWKAYKPDFDRDDAVWETPIGKGRPGWHLECSAIIRKHFGSETIDIHCGGIDLKFPHHENEIAQSEGVLNGKKFCNYFVHNGFVNLGEEKMSKSKGNFYTLRTACPKADDVRAYRYLVVSSHYRNPLMFSPQAIQASKKALKRIDHVKEQLTIILTQNKDSKVESSTTSTTTESSNLSMQVQKNVENFELALLDDLSMPRASASLFAIVKMAEKYLKTIDKDANDNFILENIDLAGIQSLDEAIMKMDQVFGILYTVPKTQEEIIQEQLEKEIPTLVIELVEQRAKAKEEKQWDLADDLRNRIQELGFTVKDVKNGDPIISRI